MVYIDLLDRNIKDVCRKPADLSNSERSMCIWNVRFFNLCESIFVSQVSNLCVLIYKYNKCNSVLLILKQYL